MSSHDQTTAISLTTITKVYTIHHEKPTFAEKFIKNKEEKFIALKNVNVDIKKGERVGIIGPNGSGKTTLLKIIARITTPTSGTVKTNGRIVSLIDLEAGFHPDLTGIQNVYLNGMLLGMHKRDVTRSLDAIIRFADIKQFIDAPLFTYSEGMKLRLGFAIAIHARPDILILDEGLSVGDENFQKKTYKKIQELKRHHITILISSHWKEFVYANCQRIIELNRGKIIGDHPV